MSFMLPQMRSASDGQLADPYKDGSLGQRPLHLARSLRGQRFAHGYYSQVSCRLTDTGRGWNGKHGGAPVAAIHEIPILLAPGENECE